MIIEIVRVSPDGLRKTTYLFDVSVRSGENHIDVRLGSYREWIRPSRRHRNYTCLLWWDRFPVNLPVAHRVPKPVIPSDVKEELGLRLAAAMKLDF